MLTSLVVAYPVVGRDLHEVDRVCLVGGCWHGVSMDRGTRMHLNVPYAGAPFCPLAPFAPLPPFAPFISHVCPKRENRVICIGGREGKGQEQDKGAGQTDVSPCRVDHRRRDDMSSSAKRPLDQSDNDGDRVIALLDSFNGPMGVHMGVKDTCTTAGIRVHTDCSGGFDTHMANVRAWSRGEPDTVFRQRLVHKVTHRSQLTRMLYLHPSTYKSLPVAVPVDIYIQFLGWVRSTYKKEMKDVMDKRGMVKWPTVVVGTKSLGKFMSWRRQTYGEDNISHARSVMTFEAPPERLCPGIVTGEDTWVVQEWITGQPHAGPPMSKDTSTRVSIFQTGEPFITEDFMSRMRAFQRELDVFIKTSPDGPIEDLRAEIMKHSDWFVRRYRITCMGGSSHFSFIKRVVATVAAQHTRGEMRATLWHSENVEMSMHEAANADVSQPPVHTVDEAEMSSARVLPGWANEVLTETVEILSGRVFNLMDMTSNLNDRPTSLCDLFEPCRRTWTNGILGEGRHNIPNCAWRLLKSGFGAWSSAFIRICPEKMTRAHMSAKRQRV